MRVPIAVAVLVVAGGCNALLGVHGFGGGGDGGGPGDGASGDGDGDAATDAPPKVTCNLANNFGAPELIKELEDPAHSVFITDVDAAGTTLFIASDRGGVGFELWSATRADATAPWSTPAVLSAVVPSDWVAVTEDGLRAIVSGLQFTSEDLFLARRNATTDPFPVGSAIGGGVDTNGIEDTPRLTRNGATLYFASDRNDNRHDLFTAKINGDTFSQPLLLDGSGLNTSLHETAPALTADELTLYFTRGDQNNKGRDIFVVTRASKTSFFNGPTPATELSSGVEDVVGALSPDGCTIYINRIEDAPLRARPYVAVKPP